MRKITGETETLTGEKLLQRRNRILRKGSIIEGFCCKDGKDFKESVV